MRKYEKDFPAERKEIITEMIFLVVMVAWRGFSTFVWGTLRKSGDVILSPCREV